MLIGYYFMFLYTISDLFLFTATVYLFENQNTFLKFISFLLLCFENVMNSNRIFDTTIFFVVNMSFSFVLSVCGELENYFHLK